MRLTDYLSKAGYDSIDGPVRNHKPLQIWLKQGFNSPELYYEAIHHAFASNVDLKIKEDKSLAVDNDKKDEYAFNIGITMLDELLKAIGLGASDLTSKIKTGRKLGISYKQAITKTVPVGDITHFLSSADFIHPNPALLRNANQNNLLLITGVVYAQQLKIEIDTSLGMDQNWVAAMKDELKGKFDLRIDQDEKLEMVADIKDYFPVAVKASRLDFDKGKFKGLLQVTDNRNFF
jgi:hypothetical protein